MKDWFVHGGLKGRQPGVPMPRTAAGAEDLSREFDIDQTSLWSRSVWPLGPVAHLHRWPAVVAACEQKANRWRLPHVPARLTRAASTSDQRPRNLARSATPWPTAWPGASSPA